MKIQEKDNKAGLEIAKVKMNCDYPLTDNKGRMPPLPLCQTSGFLYCINGFSGSGKTTTLINLLSKRNKDGKKMSYRKCFDKILFVSPSAHTINHKEIQDLENKYTTLDDELIDNIEEMTDKNALEDEPEQYLLVLDDVGAMIRSNKRLETRLCMLCNNRRHRHLSIIILTQQLMQIPPPIRKNLSMLFCYKPKNSVEKDILFKEFVDAPVHEFNELMEYVFKDKRDFLLIDCSLRNSADIEYFRNFNRLLFFANDPEK